MKDRNAILIVACILAILFQISIETTLFEDNWSIINPIIIAIISCLLLIRIQLENQNTFLKHLLKTFKINFFALVMYIPICLLLSVRWENNLQNSFNKFAGIIPKILASVITTGVTLFGSIIIISIISYFIGRRNQRVQPLQELDEQ